MRILTKLILPILLTFCFGSTLGQGKEKLIKQIRKEFKSINSDTTLKKVVLTNAGSIGPN